MDLQVFVASVGTRLCNGDSMGYAIRGAAINHDHEVDVIKARLMGRYSPDRPGEFEQAPEPFEVAAAVVFAVQPVSVKSRPRIIKTTNVPKQEALHMLSEHLGVELSDGPQSVWRRFSMWFKRAVR